MGRTWGPAWREAREPGARHQAPATRRGGCAYAFTELEPTPHGGRARPTGCHSPIQEAGMSRWSGLQHLVWTSLALGAGLARAPAARAQAQRVDQEYTQKIKEYLQDPRISTELVDHLPASSTVPTPLKFLGRIVGTPGELTYAPDIHR